MENPASPTTTVPETSSVQLEPIMKPVEIKKPFPVLIILLVVLLVLSLLVTVFFVYQNMQLTKELSSIKTTDKMMVEASPVATADPSSNWETYTGISNDYVFKHPMDLKSDTTSAGTGFESIRFTFIGPVQIASGRTQTELFDGYFFSVTKAGPLVQFDPKTEAIKQQQNSKETCPQVSDVSEVTVNGTSAFKYGCPNNYDMIYVTNGKNTYYITQFYTGDNLNGYKTITDQILSTFKFTQ